MKQKIVCPETEKQAFIARSQHKENSYQLRLERQEGADRARPIIAILRVLAFILVS